MSDPTITTRYGKLRGSDVGGVNRFLGIPYAAPPLGELRFRAPRPPASWSGVRDALAFGPVAPQIGEPGRAQMSAAWQSMDGHVADVAQSEDCLSLNIWTQASDNGAHRPVMVWFHGGGLRSGSSRVEAYDGAALARQGVVFVSVNYRLGALGFLAHPDLADDSGAAGNWGLLDMLAALSWVRENIAAFGGDPENVTAFGQSAGGSAIAAMFALPERSPFDKAIIQSGAPKSVSLDDAATRAEQVARHVGASSVGDLRNAPLAAILEAQHAAEGPGSPMVFIITEDGGLFARSPYDLIADGHGHDVPRMFGANRDEWRRYVPLDPKALDMDEARLERRLSRALPGDVRQIIDVYRQRREARGESTSPGAIWFDVSGDTYFRLPMRRLQMATEHFETPEFDYLFEYPSPFHGGKYGTCHCLELPLLFGTWSDPQYIELYQGAPDAAAISEVLRSTWIEFARTGNPNNPMLGEWPPFDSASRPIMVLGSKNHVEPDPFEPALALLAARATGKQSAVALGIARTDR